MWVNAIRIVRGTLLTRNVWGSWDHIDQFVLSELCVIRCLLTYKIKVKEQQVTLCYQDICVNRLYVNEFPLYSLVYITHATIADRVMGCINKVECVRF